ncbi:MAG: class I SAM-dependent methyltransferase [Bradyrhizobium sp.]
MLAHKEDPPYDREFYQGMVHGALRAARAIVPIVLANFPVRSAVDIGCGPGAWLHALEERDVTDIRGYDGDYVDRSTLLIEPGNFVPVDLCQDFAIDRTFDLAISLEVAEHIPERFAEPLIGRLVAAAPVVLFSAAIPGQFGVNHINLQWQDYWRSIFRSLGFHPVDLIRPQVWGHPEVEYWYQQNIILYCGDAALRDNPQLQPIPDNRTLNIVHPALYDAHLARSGRSLTTALRLLPSLARDAARRRIKTLRSPP